MLEQEPKQTLEHETEHAPKPELSSPSPRENPSTHPIHPTQRSSTPQRATMDGPTNWAFICPAKFRDLAVDAELVDCNLPAGHLGRHSHRPIITTAKDLRTTVRPVMGLVARDGACCGSHVVEGCCDPNDCGPCCEDCPTCPVTLGWSRTTIAAELRRTERDLAVAVHEASTARAVVAELTALLRSLPGLITSTAGQRHSGQVGAAVRRSAMAEASDLVRLAVAESVGSRRDARAAALADRPTLAQLQARYLEVREHTLSTAGIITLDRFSAQGRYVRGEAAELWNATRDYVQALNEASFEPDPSAFAVDELREVRHEIADVVIAATTLAGMLPGDDTVEACIAEKTEQDRGRG